MKQPKPAKSPLPPSPAPVPQGPRYRYFSNPPSTVTVRLGDLAAQIPSALRLAAFDEGRTVELPCDEILRGPVPRIPLSRLAALVPECVVPPSEQDPSLRLPAARLAAGYRFIQTQELIEEPAPPAIEEEFAPPENVEVVPEEVLPEMPPASFAPPADPFPVAEDPGLSAPLSSVSAPAMPQAPSAPISADEVPPVPPVPAQGNPLPSEIPFPQGNPPAEGSAFPQVNLSPEKPPFSEGTAFPPDPVPPQAPEVPQPPQATPVPPPSKLPPSRRVFSILPIFRRKEAEASPAVPPPKPPEPRPRVEIPRPKLPQTPLTTAKVFPPPPPEPPAEILPDVLAEEAVPLPPPPAPSIVPEETPAISASEVPLGETPAPISEPTESAPQISLKEEPVSTAVWVETEHLPQSGRNAPEEIPDQDGLQAVFMTEEFLSLDRVITLCGGLPGIKSCVLAHGSAVLAAHSVPDSIDIVSLSANALEMLRGMRESSAKMGVGAIPAVTLHSDKGPITFFHQDDLCLLVLHKDRGFVPGVREKLQQVVEELGKANLPLLVSPAKSSLKD